MLNSKIFTWYIFGIPIAILVLIISLANPKEEIITPVVVSSMETSSADSEVPIYEIAMSEDTQRDIWILCEANNVSYELVLTIYQIEDINNYQMDNMRAQIEKLVYYRDYWTELGYPDEIVFDLVLLSHQRGIEGCIIYMKDNDTYDTDSYVQSVTEYKYNLEHSLDLNEQSHR